MMRSWLVLLVVLLVPKIASAQSSDVQRGRYLATLGDCAICHTAPGGSGKSYAGGYPLHAYFGTVYSTNITPDKATGIGTWSKDAFYHAIHDGIAADGHHLYPAFPYLYFTKISRADSDSLYAYLRTVKPVIYTPPPNRLIFPTNIRFGMVFWDWMFLDKTPLKPDGVRSTAWNRGKFLVDTIGHCGACHTPKTFLFTDKPGRYLQGETIDGWFAPNLTGSWHTGLGAWTAEDIEDYLKTGNNRFGRVTGAMQDVVRVSTSRMSDNDRHAIALYLKSLPPAPENTPATPDAADMRLGEAVFVQRCAICHAKNADYPSLKDNSVVVQPDPTTLIRVILQGSQSVATQHVPAGFSMPSFPVLRDEELAALVTYIRNSWGNAADPVSKRRAKQIRRGLRPKG
jgi:mono/diheme cytochrome c family protein